MTTLRIAIAGAGIGGLAAAALLARDGHRVTLYDQFEKPAPVGSGLILQETGLTVLNELGLREEAEHLAAPIRRLHGISAGSGRTVLDVRYAAMRDRLCGRAVLRPVLFDLVYRAAAEAGAEIVPGTRITAANAVAGQLVTGTGASLGPFDLVINALGVYSPLSSTGRNMLDYGALWATLDWPSGTSFCKEALEQRYYRASRMAGVMPSGRMTGSDRQTLTYFWSIRRDAVEAWRAAPLTHWKDAAVGLWPETRPLLEQIRSHDQLTFARYDHRTRWPAVEGRLVHLGDSWHAASPQLGQGANMALLDAYALARAMRGERSLPDRLNHYVRMRAMHVRLFQAMSWMFTPVYQSDSVSLAWLRDWLAAPVSRVPPAPYVLAAMVSGAIGSPLKRLGLKPGA